MATDYKSILEQFTGVIGDVRNVVEAVIGERDPTTNPLVIPAGSAANDPAGEIGSGEVPTPIQSLSPTVKILGAVVIGLVILKLIR